MSDEKVWYLYVIRCRNDSLYCGITTDVFRRFSEHRKMGPKTAKYLMGKNPLTLVLAMSIGNRSEALRAEMEFKALAKKEKEAYIAEYDFTFTGDA